MAETTPDQLTLMALMIGAVPERESEVRQLWLDYHPKVIVESAERLTLKADCEKITIDVKIPDVFWLIGFSGWRAIETYDPAIVCSVKRSVRISAILARDDTFSEFERDYKERIAAAQAFIAAREVGPWPLPTDQKRRGLRRLDRGQTGVPLSEAPSTDVVLHPLKARNRRLAGRGASCPGMPRRRLSQRMEWSAHRRSAKALRARGVGKII
jgi:hypothetical protein